MQVTVRDGDLEGAIRILKRKNGFERLIMDMKRHEFHQTRAERRKAKDRAALKRILNKARRSHEFGSEF